MLKCLIFYKKRLTKMSKEVGFPQKLRKLIDLGCLFDFYQYAKKLTIFTFPEVLERKYEIE